MAGDSALIVNSVFVSCLNDSDNDYYDCRIIQLIFTVEVRPDL